MNLLVWAAAALALGWLESDPATGRSPRRTIRRPARGVPRRRLPGAQLAGPARHRLRALSLLGAACGLLLALLGRRLRHHLLPGVVLVDLQKLQQERPDAVGPADTRETAESGEEAVATAGRVTDAAVRTYLTAAERDSSHPQSPLFARKLLQSRTPTCTWITTARTAAARRTVGADVAAPESLTDIGRTRSA